MTTNTLAEATAMPERLMEDLLLQVRVFYNRYRQSTNGQKLAARPVARAVLQCVPLEVREDETPPDAFLRAAKVLQRELPGSSPRDLLKLLERCRHYLVESAELVRICMSIYISEEEQQTLLDSIQAAVDLVRATPK